MLFDLPAQRAGYQVERFLPTRGAVTVRAANQRSREPTSGILRHRKPLPVRAAGSLGRMQQANVFVLDRPRTRAQSQQHLHVIEKHLLATTGYGANLATVRDSGSGGGCRLFTTATKSRLPRSHLCTRMGKVQGLVAQRLEQRTHNPLVPGSNPGGPTKFIQLSSRSSGSWVVTRSLSSASGVPSTSAFSQKEMLGAFHASGDTNVAVFWKVGKWCSVPPKRRHGARREAQELVLIVLDLEAPFRAQNSFSCVNLRLTWFGQRRTMALGFVSSAGAADNEA